MNWNGYQPPLKSLNPGSLIKQGYVPPNLKAAVVHPRDFDKGHFLLELAPEVDQLWHSAWEQFKAGATG